MALTSPRFGAEARRVHAQVATDRYVISLAGEQPATFFQSAVVFEGSPGVFL
jgi:hypothetical protein